VDRSTEALRNHIKDKRRRRADHVDAGPVDTEIFPRGDMLDTLVGSDPNKSDLPTSPRTAGTGSYPARPDIPAGRPRSKGFWPTSHWAPNSIIRWPSLVRQSLTADHPLPAHFLAVELLTQRS
jgi:hypothetical protein